MKDITAALSHHPDKPFALERVTLDTPGEGEVLVRMVASGICHTDLHYRSLLPPEGGPYVLGHEGTGIVEETGSGVTGIRPGDRVVLSYRHCGACAQCRAGRPAYCARLGELNAPGPRPDGTYTLRQDGKRVTGGFFGQSSFATHVLASADNTVVVDADTDLLTAAPLGCGVQTGVGAVLNVLRPEPSSSLVVYGAGAVGCAALMAARAEEVGTVVAVDPVPGRRELALRLGATAVLDPASDDIVAAVRELTGGGASHAFDTSGVPSVIADAALALGRAGVLVLVGLGKPQLTVDVDDIMRCGKTLRGCIEGDARPQEFIPYLLRMRAKGLLPLEEIITTYPFADIDRAVADSHSGVTVKPVLVF
ncbi:NAD(P)-dependent alcohol dehydrogenase [Streptomyces sp. V3I7]|uniref:NAD(P)-dependent alcohol dehydrogenase n=1 Tax=Streptomyces sp. V3I7 TaxID=3042278 RepID=UPI002784C323|nr:NAD(P)-dependent alcohol dehydrogenase [Streptomyces sp. V3I7]MDQ0989342.1 aryl-alcohol dehydrogenase [Streptomyces sp. V3I7]